MLIETVETYTSSIWLSSLCSDFERLNNNVTIHDGFFHYQAS